MRRSTRSGWSRATTAPQCGRATTGRRAFAPQSMAYRWASAGAQVEAREPAKVRNPVDRPERAYEIAAKASAAPGPGGAPLIIPIEVRQVMSAPRAADA